MPFAFELARPEDEAELREMAARIAVPGTVEVSYRREPDYFQGCAAHGPFVQVIAARDQAQRLVGMGCRSVSPLWVNGRVQQVGYLSGLRVDPGLQGQGMLAQSFRFLRQLDEDGKADLTITTVIEGNDVAKAVLVDRPGPSQPRYQFLFRLLTHALPLLPRKPRSHGFEIRQALDSELEECWARFASERQFFPALEAGRLGLDAPALESFVVALKDGEVCGSMALWAPPARQTVVERYRGPLGWTRGLLSKLTSLPLPEPGSELPMAYVALGCGTVEAYRALLEHLYGEARRRGYGFLMAGLAESDPCCEVVNRFPHWTYPSQVYAVLFQDQEVRIDGRTPYLEIGTL